MKYAKSVLALGLVWSMSAVAQTKWDMPTPYSPTIFHTENVVQFASDVDKATGGKLKITVHPNGSLFRANEIKRAVQGGQAQAGEIIISGYSNEDPIFGVDSVPFFATSYADAAKLWKISREAIEARFARQGMKVLYTVPWPPQGLFTNKPINSLADMKGLKLRTYNPATSRIAELVGAQPVMIQASEQVQALATGVANANITSAATGNDIKAWEQTKYFYDLQAWLPKDIVFVNQKAFDGIDKGSQDAVLRAAAEAEARGWKTSEEKAKKYVEQLAAHGMIVAAPSAALKAELKQVGDTMINEWAKTAGPDGQAIIDSFKK